MVEFYWYLYAGAPPPHPLQISKISQKWKSQTNVSSVQLSSCPANTCANKLNGSSIRYQLCGSSKLAWVYWLQIRYKDDHVLSWKFKSGHTQVDFECLMENGLSWLIVRDFMKYKMLIHIKSAKGIHYPKLSTFFLTRKFSFTKKTFTKLKKIVQKFLGHWDYFLNNYRFHFEWG